MTTTVDNFRGKLFRRKGVPPTPELARILGLPTRDWQAEAPEMVGLLTAVLKRPGGSMTLRPVQAMALTEAYDCGGALLMVRVAGGKTLTSFLLPEVLQAERPLLLVPGKLTKKTQDEWWQLQAHWKLPKIRIESYSKLGVVANAEYLQNYRPDVIIADEGHKLKNPKAAVTRRVKRYLQVAECVVIIMSGTVTAKSLHDYWHLLKWTHGPEAMPIPAEWGEMSEWSDCLDVNTSAQKLAPGALAELCTDSERSAIRYGGEAAIQAVRTAFQRRLTSTPGVISTVDDKGVNCSLVIESIDPGLKRLDDTFAQMRRTWETPDGHPFFQAVDMWRHARELACGFYYVWDPRPPQEWLIAKRMWAKFVRGVLKHSHKYDSEMQVAKACAKGDLDCKVEVMGTFEELECSTRIVDVYQGWREVRDTFKPNTVPRWVDDTVINRAHQWLHGCHAGQIEGIVWVEHNAFGRRLSELSGYPYYGAGGWAGDVHIMYASGPIICSINAIGEGYNLQKYSRNLVTSCPPNGKTWQQLLARTHRDGQEADEVSFECFIGCLEQWTGMQQALKDARYIQDSTGDPQKLLLADLVLMSADEVASLEGGRWTKERE